MPTRSPLAAVNDQAVPCLSSLLRLNTAGPWVLAAVTGLSVLRRVALRRGERQAPLQRSKFIEVKPGECAACLLGHASMRQTANTWRDVQMPAKCQARLPLARTAGESRCIDMQEPFWRLAGWYLVTFRWPHSLLGGTYNEEFTETLTSYPFRGNTALIFSTLEGRPLLQIVPWNRPTWPVELGEWLSGSGER